MQTRVNRRKFIVSATCSICGSLILPSCAQVPLTNRNQLNLYDSNLPIVIFQGSLGGIPIPKVYANEKSLNKEIDKEIYVKGDKFSHLTSDAYLNYFLPIILRKIIF